jgi:hypothetical protein
MNREEIIRMAREAGFNPVSYTGANLELFERFAALVAAHKREWVGLTDEEIWSNGSRLSLSERGIREFARAIEAKLKDKNQ